MLLSVSDWIAAHVTEIQLVLGFILAIIAFCYMAAYYELKDRLTDLADELDRVTPNFTVEYLDEQATYPDHLVVQGEVLVP